MISKDEQNSHDCWVKIHDVVLLVILLRNVQHQTVNFVQSDY